jgi:DNA helicase II / ATP-dependent DNA helicase PcrA
MRDLLYLLAARQRDPEGVIQLESHNLSTGEIDPLMITSKKEQRLYDEIERSLHGIEKREFPARPLEPARCPTCPFFFICPA